MTSDIKRPEVVGNLNNAVIYFLLLGLITAGVVIVLGMLILPIIFLPYQLREARKAYNDPDFRKNIKMSLFWLQTMLVILNATSIALASLFLYFCYHNGI